MRHPLFPQPVKAEHGQDRQLKAFAAKYLPVLEQHLQMAESIASK
ncbi:MAG: DUF4142 domain-containing protein [Rhodopila sp.]